MDMVKPNMNLVFVSHQWKSFWRSKNTGKSIVVQVVMGILILYLLANFLFISFFLDKILSGIFPGQDVVTSFCGVLLYYFLLDICSRYQLQELPTLRVQPYLHLPIKRHKIVGYLSLTSLLSAFTLTPFVLTLPFLIKVLLPQYGTLPFLGILLSIIGLSMFNHFFILWLKRKENMNSWFIVLFLAMIAGAGSLDFYWHSFSISSYSSTLFGGIISHPFYCLATILLGLLMYGINYNYLKENLYLEELYTISSSKKSSTEYPFLNRFGKVGDLAAIELKLIFRNKRPKTTVMKGLIFIFYGLIFYRNPQIANSPTGLIFCPMFMMGIFIMTYGQFMFGWQSVHFDGILVNRISARDFFKSKFLLFFLFSSLTFLVTIPYVYFGKKILLMHFIMYLWNLGVSSLIVLFFANSNYKRIDLSKKASFNWEGVGASQLILGIPLFLSPFIIYLPFKWMGYESMGLVALAVVGLMGIVTRNFWLDLLVQLFNKKRYQIAEGFRNE
jgi:hypothetical protein